MRTITAILIATLSAAPLAAADLVEPWARGLSNLEVAFAGASGGDLGTGSILVGAGLTDRVSVGLSATGGSAETRFGALLLYSQPLGRLGEVDAWCETPLDSSPASLGCGFEWSRSRSLLVPYARLSFDWEAPSDSLTTLAGLMVPVSEALGLHLELSLEAAETVRRPLRFAVGPNWQISPRLEVIPELAWRHDHEEDSFQAAFCFAMDISRGD